MRQTAFDRIGGFAAVSSIVMDFYDRVLDSEKAGDFFEGIDVARLIDHQTKFVAALLGGPASFTDTQIQRAHEHLKIDDESFNELITILSQTLKDHGVPEADANQIRKEMDQRRSIIVTS